MARKRMIDPNIWQSEDFGKLSTLAKIVFIGLFSLADDEGKGRCNPVYLKSMLFPYEESIRSADIDKTLSEISSNMSVIFYSYDGSNYYSLLSWDTFQKIDRPSQSKILEYDENTMELLFGDNSTNNRRGFVPNKNIIENNKNIKESKKKKYGENKNVSFTDEELKKVKAYFPNDYMQRIQALDDYMQSTGKKYKDYFATLRNWAKKDGYKPPATEEKKQEQTQEYKEVDISGLTEEEYSMLVKKKITIQELIEKGRIHV